MAHPCKHVDRFEISQVSLNDSVAVVQQIEAPGGIDAVASERRPYRSVFRTMTPRRACASRDVGIIAKSAASLSEKHKLRLRGITVRTKSRHICTPH